MLLQVFVPYHRYVHVLKWLTLSLLAYVGVVFTVAIDWGAVVRGIFWPQVSFSRETVIAIVAASAWRELSINSASAVDRLTYPDSRTARMKFEATTRFRFRPKSSGRMAVPPLVEFTVSE